LSAASNTAFLKSVSSRSAIFLISGQSFRKDFKITAAQRGKDMVEQFFGAYALVFTPMTNAIVGL